MKDLLQYLKEYLNGNSFFLLLITAIFFITNIKVYEHLPSDSYKNFGLIFTYITIQNNISALGFEQMMIRFSYVSSKTLKISFNYLFSSILAVLVTSITLSYIIKGTLNSEKLIFFIFLLSGLIMICSKLLILQGNKDFITLVSNSWRLPIVVFLFTSEIKFFIYSLIFIQLATLILSISLIIRTKILFRKASFFSNDNLRMNLMFLFSLLTLTLITNLDKLIIFKNAEIEIANDFFFAANIFGITSIIQNLNNINFIRKFKLIVSLNEIKKDEKVQSILSLIVITFSIIVYLIFRDTDLDLNPLVIIFFILLSIIKLNYSIYSSIVGGNIEAKQTRTINHYSILTIILYLFMYQIPIGLNAVLIITILVWIYRLRIWKKLSNEIGLG